jgi:hypothetical protein
MPRREQQPHQAFDDRQLVGSIIAKGTRGPRHRRFGALTPPARYGMLRSNDPAALPFVADGQNKKVHIVNRDTLPAKVRSGGRYPG